MDSKGAMRVGEEAIGRAPFLDRDLIGKVSTAILLSTNELASYKSGYRVDEGEGFYKGPFFDPAFAYRLKQSLDVYWEDDGWDADHHYQRAEDFIFTACDIHGKISRLSNKRNETRFEIFRRVHRAKQILDSGEYIHFNLEQLAQQCVMSKYFLVRSFKQIYQITPQKYLTMRKMSIAKSLLAQGSSVGDVASKLGYPDIFSFSKQFKKYTGASARRVRASAMDLTSAVAVPPQFRAA